MSQDFESRMQAILEKQPDEAIHEFLNDVYDYIGFVNKVSELLRLSEGIGTEPLDKDITIGDIMLSVIRKGEILHTSAEILHEYASNIEQVDSE